ncbi:hypothetical protein J2W30_003232 [Variovorax boronicumulans]|uniref:hypothetical protein n=1 Tax=Variovorax boronicumulans TaxID=436515 RepID=UPI0027831303|nr:hypothetical protein [Variovorax boronicumulans]MDQ0035464.1 hypothetical protein [Variovorax boronicumulans]
MNDRANAPTEYERLKQQKNAILERQQAEQIEALLALATRYAAQASNVWRTFVPHASGDFIELNEFRAALTSASKQEGGEPELLRGVDALLREAYEHWDADRELKVGKILLALIGFNKGYDKRADAWCAALKPKPAPLNGGCGDGES